MATSSKSPFPQDDGLWTFLQNRGIPRENIEKMQQDHIDSTVVGEIDDATMAKYIPAYGDRIAVRHFCLEKQTRGGGECKRMSLFEKLRRKMGTASNKDKDDDSEVGPSMKPTATYLRNNKRAKKMTRKVELGWIHDNRQVRKRGGGGTRVLDVSKNDTKRELLSHAKKLFFPNDKSGKGSWEEFTHDIVDFQTAKLDETVCVGDLYETYKLGMLRFYLLTESLTSGDDDDEFTEVEGGADKHRDAERSDKQEKKTQNDEQLAQNIQIGKQQLHTVENDEQSTLEVSALNPTTVEFIDLTSVCNTSEVIFGPFPGGQFVGELDDTVLHVPILQVEETEVNNITYTSTPVHLPQQILPTEREDDFCTSTLVPSEEVTAAPPSPTCELLHVTVKLHRVKLLDELITQFKDEAMMSYSVKYSFIDEKGADADGVSRDVYAAFWTEFLDCAAEGADMRVPSLSSKWQEEEWKSVGRILVKGLKDHGYFPFRLAQAFTAAVTFGEHSVPPDLLFDSLMLYLSQTERDLLSRALQETVVGDDKDELLDLLDRMGVRTAAPTPGNLKAVLLQVAHKEIIQQPKYALDNIAAVAGPFLRNFFPSLEDIQKMYNDLKPTTRKVLKLITASPTTPAEIQSLRFLHQFIRGLDEKCLLKMLRFMTGSDVICIEGIEVTFTTLEGLARRPIAHTCGPTLELPSTYQSYPELRVEMESILKSNNCYEMDIA